MFRRRLESLNVDDLERLLDDVRQRSLLAFSATGLVACVLGALASASPDAGVVGVLMMSAAVFALSKSPVLPHLQPVPAACAAWGLDAAEADRLQRILVGGVGVGLSLSPSRPRAEAVARSLRDARR